MPVIARHIFKSFGSPAISVLKDISLEIRDGEFVSLTGRSGSGKSTLLYLLSSLDRPTSGEIEIHGEDLAHISDEDLHWLRNQHVGFVFQFPYLIAELNVIDNVLMPAFKFGLQEQRRSLARDLLDRFGIGDKCKRYPRQLSGGEQQRVSIARALIMSPRYIFADEPTGSLDTAGGENVMRILEEENQRNGTSVVLVTHDPDFAMRAERQIRLVDGKIAEVIQHRQAVAAVR